MIEFTQDMNAVELEWHRLPGSKEIVEDVIQRAFDPDVIGTSHHLGWVKNGVMVDVASIETLLFNHGFLKQLFGDRYLEVARKLAETPEFERLEAIKKELQDHG